MARLGNVFAVGLAIAWGCGGDSDVDPSGTDTAATQSGTTQSAGTSSTSEATTSTGATTAASTSSSSSSTTADTGTEADDSGTTDADTGDSTTSAVVTASATLEPKSDSDAMGTAVFTVLGDDSVELVIELTGVEPPGTHALHIHEFPDCSADDGSSTGMHWNPSGTTLGELGTIEIDEAGVGTFTKSDAWSIGTGRDNDVVGRSIIIHEDDDGGTRIACGVIDLD